MRLLKNVILRINKNDQIKIIDIYHLTLLWKGEASKLCNRVYLRAPTYRLLLYVLCQFELQKFVKHVVKQEAISYYS